MENLDVKIPTTRNGKATFQNIVDTAINCFYKNGYHNTSMADIAKEAGIATGTTYLYFKSKIALYKYILSQFQHDIRRRISEKISTVDGRFEKEREGMRTFIHYAIENPHSYNIIWESLSIDRQLFIDYYHGFSKRYEIGLRQSVQDGEMVDVDTELVSYILMGVANFIGLKILFDLGDSKKNPDQIVDEVMDIIKSGIFKK